MLSVLPIVLALRQWSVTNPSSSQIHASLALKTSSDGLPDAAGAIVDGETLARARELGLSAADYMSRNDSYRFFDQLGDLIRTGPTNTNVNDLFFVLAP